MRYIKKKKKDQKNVCHISGPNDSKISEDNRGMVLVVEDFTQKKGGLDGMGWEGVHHVEVWRSLA